MVALKMMNELRVSVIVTAYNRKNFIYQAIDSLLKQKIDPSLFEIITVSNFALDIKDISGKFQVSSIVIEGTIGEFLYAGIKRARYGIVAFLDDDDLFEPEKIKIIIDTFSREKDLCYYHNNQKYVDANLHSLNYVRLVESRSRFSMVEDVVFGEESNLDPIRDALAAGGDFNLSSITIRKESAKDYLSTMRSIKSNPDGFFFWMTLIFKGKLLIDHRKLTVYRLHALNISGQKDFEKKTMELKRQIYTYNLLLDFINNHHPLDEIDTYLGEWICLYRYEYELMLYVFGNFPRRLMLDRIRRILSLDKEFTNTLKYRILLFGTVGVISTKLSCRLYSVASKIFGL